MKYDLHIHSKYSLDSILSPEMILKLAIKKGLNGIAITDHNTIEGGLKTLKTNTNKDFQVTIGAEIKTEYGDIIGIFLNEEIKSRKFIEIIDEIKDQDGYSILPHPFRNHKHLEILVQKADLIETFNARSKKTENEKAGLLAKDYNKPVSAGSDSHLPFEVGRAYIKADCEIRSILKSGKIFSAGKESNYYVVHGLSYFAEKIRKVS